MRHLVAHCHLGLGKLCTQAGKREQAREHLTMATTMLREMGMRFWLEKSKRRCRDALSTRLQRRVAWSLSSVSSTRRRGLGSRGTPRTRTGAGRPAALAIVDVTVQVRQIDVEGVDRCGECHVIPSVQSPDPTLRARPANRWSDSAGAPRARSRAWACASVAGVGHAPAAARRVATCEKEGSYAWRSCAARSASSRISRPISLPAEVVMGAFGRSCVAMNSAISAMGTCGRNVLGPGRMADSAVSSSSWPSCSTRSSPMTICSSLTTTQASHRAARTRFRASRRGSSRWHVGTSGARPSPRSAVRPLHPRWEVRPPSSRTCPPGSRTRCETRGSRAATRLAGSGLRRSPSNRRRRVGRDPGRP